MDVPASGDSAAPFPSHLCLFYFTFTLSTVAPHTKYGSILSFRNIQGTNINDKCSKQSSHKPTESKKQQLIAALQYHT